jgi:hypothetical protein
MGGLEHEIVSSSDDDGSEVVKSQEAIDSAVDLIMGQIDPTKEAAIGNMPYFLGDTDESSHVNYIRLKFRGEDIILKEIESQDILKTDAFTKWNTGVMFKMFKNWFKCNFEMFVIIWLIVTYTLSGGF